MNFLKSLFQKNSKKVDVIDDDTFHIPVLEIKSNYKQFISEKDLKRRAFVEQLEKEHNIKFSNGKAI